MKSKSLLGRLVALAWFTGAFGLCLPGATSAADAAGGTTANDDWQFKAEAYGWLPTIKSELATGDEIELDLNDIFDYLDMTFMGVFQARKGKWAFVSDVTYLKLSGDRAGNRSMPIGPFDVPTRVDIGVEAKGWLVNLAGAYRVLQAEKFDVQLLAGARYLSVDVDATLDTSLIPGSKILDASNHVWDGIVGVRGLANLSDKWWLTYRFDIGTGDSDLTWNASAQFGRKYDWGSLAVGYRYLHYDFDSNFKVMKDLDIYGPVIGAAWEF